MSNALIHAFTSRLMFSCSSKWQHSKNRLGVEKIAAVLHTHCSWDLIYKTQCRFHPKSVRRHKSSILPEPVQKNSFIDPSQGKIMHACISSEITICVRDSTGSQSPATNTHPITCSLQSALLHIHTSLRCSTSGLLFSYLN